MKLLNVCCSDLRGEGISQGRQEEEAAEAEAEA